MTKLVNDKNALNVSVTKKTPQSRLVRFKRRWREALALVAVIAITILVFVFDDTFAGSAEYGYAGAFLAMLMSSATLILPAPGFILVFTLGAVVGNPLLLGIAAGAGAALGELTGYLAGFSGNQLIQQTAIFKRFERYLDRYAYWAIAVLAFIPNPLFDVAGVIAGSLRMPWWRFLLATFAGKATRCILIAYAGYWSLSWFEVFV